MPTFRDTDHLYEVLDALFRRLSEHEEAADGLLSGGFVLRFRYTDPVGQATIDLRDPPVTWVFGETELAPDLEMSQSADTAHKFWLGRLNIPRAIATRQVVSRGPVAKALKLLPAVKPAYAMYPQVLRDLGYGDLVPVEVGPDRRWRDWLSRLSRLLRFQPRRRGTGDLEARRTHPIPLMVEAPEEGLAYRDQGLPKEEPELKREMLSRMWLIRAFEEKISAAWARGEVPTEAIHLSIGQEGVAVGVCFALRAEDLIATTHRGHGHMLAKGADLSGMMAEMLAKADGLCGGKGGSMHVTEAEVGAIGANGIVGASPLVAAGAAHAARLGDTGQVAVAFLGDGATNQGMFHEAVNLAAVLDLPALFVIENNQYGEFTPLNRHTRVTRLSDRAAAYGIPGVTVDGNDVWAVYQATLEAAARARRGEGPTLLECLTYRWHGHMEGESVDYRPAEEIAAWKDRCPIASWERALVEGGLLTEEAGQGLRQGATERVSVAFAQAVDSPDPGPDALHTDIWAPEPAELFTPSAPLKSDREITFSQALFEALAEEMERDDRVYMLGEDVTTGGYFAVSVGLVDRFGPDRIVDTPISEYAIVGSAVGAAMTGRRPVAEILFSDFLTTCADPLVNQAAKLRYMSGGQYAVPLVVRTPGGAGLGMAAQHSQSLEALFTGVPGLIVVAPATPYDAKGLLKAAIRSHNPVLFFENKVLYAATGPVPAEDYIVPLGVAEVKRKGRDVTVVSVGGALGKAMDAASELVREHIEAEVVDLRTLVPLDVATVARSVSRTGRLVTVEDGSLFHGFGAEVIAQVAEVAFDALSAPPRRVAALDVPIPYNSALENAVLPDVERIVDGVRATCRR
jgi:pyruvate/2-oxoglutarate/acetoin dehydrogenase E1 component/TPP-dependent pyruvate/acetoin dehydrogenase alpha subunit